ncbi:MAG: REP-associated tyrosine transposase [Fimbriimonadales bacterium]
MRDKRKQRMAYAEAGHAHELTFSCYRGLPLLENDAFKRLFLMSLDKARKRHGFMVWAYVIMPNHVHVLVYPLRRTYSVGDILRSIKQPAAQVALREVCTNAPMLTKQLTLPDGRRRFWQAGGGYDRNLFSPEAIHASIDYMHANPVRRGLCEAIVDWEWSSARWYADLESKFEVDRCDVVLQSKGIRSQSKGIRSRTR